MPVPLRRPLALFSLTQDAALLERVCGLLGVPPGQHEQREFEDGEHKTRPLESVRGREVFVLASLYSEASAREAEAGTGARASVNDKLVRTLLFAGALRDAGAARVHVLAPYLCYARKDQRSKPRDPISTRYLAQMFEAVGVAGFVTVDVHNLAAYENAFRIATVHLSAAASLVQALTPALLTATGLSADTGRDPELAAEPEPAPIVVVSPDAGAVKRADRFRALLEARLDRAVGFAVMEKYRSAGVVRSGALVGEVAGRAAVLVDDLVASGTTLVRAGEACREGGASHVFAAVTHAVPTAAAPSTLDGGALDRIWITDTIPADHYPPEFVARRVVVVDCAPLLAGAITRIAPGVELPSQSNEAARAR